MNSPSSPRFSVRAQTEADWPEVWSILKPVFRSGEYYPLPPQVSEAEARTYWIKTDGYNGVARDPEQTLVGVYYLRPDQGGPASHICNAGYVIAPRARGQGLATALCVQSQDQARGLGFSGMKFNLVVSTNQAAIRAWEKAGLSIIGTVPRAFQHPTQGLVDAHIMYRSLDERGTDSE